MIAYSQDGTNFNNAKIFQDSSGVPSLARNLSGTLVAAFQWFPAPLHGLHWDSVAVKFSSDNGNNWTKPSAITVSGFPSNYQRPFDPAITVTDDGKYRIYFSSGVKGTGGLSGEVNTYSALSSDGIHYVFEANARFDHSSNPVIDPTVLKFNGLWHYIAPKGAPQDGAFHATSTDGLLFAQLPDIPSDNSHNWTGNLMIENPGQVRFYGSGPKVWWASSVDGNSWSAYTNTNIVGGDPGVIKLSANNYIAVYVGPNKLITQVEHQVNSFRIYPNPVGDNIFVSSVNKSIHGNLKLISLTGEMMLSATLNDSGPNSFDTGNIATGIYIVQIDDDKGIVYRQLIVVLR